ncbi:hypothetical protein OK016_26300 [Vibrio chagasii]|nr:hypothetical protein [Vibrio chagasii]
MISQLEANGMQLTAIAKSLPRSEIQPVWNHTLRKTVMRMIEQDQGCS